MLLSRQVATMQCNFNLNLPVCGFAQTTTGIILAVIQSKNENTHKTNTDSTKLGKSAK